MDSDRVRWRRRTGYAWAILLAGLGITLLALPATEYGFLFTAGVGVVAIIALFCAGQLLWHARRSPLTNLHALMAGQTVVLLVLVASFILPRVDLIKSARSICTPVLTSSSTPSASPVRSTSTTASTSTSRSSPALWGWTSWRPLTS
jgi:hypothetical protein